MNSKQSPPKPDESRRSRLRWLATSFLVGPGLALCLVHGLGLWVDLEGWRGLTNGWPLWRYDHPLYLYSAVITRNFLAQSGTTAGYDPTFMAGYAKSVVFPASSTLPELVLAVFRASPPEFVYKLYVLVSAALIPWLMAWAARLWRCGALGTTLAVALFVLYVWTDFPLSYAMFGMLPYLLAIPLGLVATGAFGRYCETGGRGVWLLASALLVLVVLVHFTSALIVAPACAAIYLASLQSPPDASRIPFSRWRHAGVWAIPALVLLLNSFWWMPGIWLASTKGASDFAFAHPEGVVKRLAQIATTEPVIQRVLWGIGGLGCLPLLRRGGPGGIGLVVFAAAGFGWGYLAGYARVLDFLQPGRHTYALYSALSIAGGFGLEQGLRWLRDRSRARLDWAAFLVLLGAGVWLFGPTVERVVQSRWRSPYGMLSSRPSPRMLWVFNRVGKYVKPGERLLYEEGGFAVEGVPDPFQDGRFSGLLALRYPIEILGGPYLHVALTTNFTQFGEAKLFGKKDWTRADFERYARIYRPDAILCWTPWARAFCRTNSDLIETLDDDGTVLIGRVRGYSGAAVVGRAEVQARPGELVVRNAEGGVDGSVVLRYHSVPCLRIDPPADWDEVFLEDDPVPFLRLRPPPGSVTFRMRFPPGWAKPAGRPSSE